MPKPSVRKPPDHLSALARAFWQSVVTEYQVDDAPALELLRLAAEALDRGAQARDVLDRDGITCVDRWGQVRAHPACAIERDSRIGVARLLRELRVLDAVPESRIPMLERTS